MKIIKQSWSFESIRPAMLILRHIENCGRTCYKSEDRNDNADIGITNKFIKSIMTKNHESVLEHESISVRIITDRGVTHELVRHRLASYSQESTRYCNYSNDKHGGEVSFICPVWFYDVCTVGKAVLPIKIDQYEIWKDTCKNIEDRYLKLLKLGQTPQEARTVLNNSLKSEIVMTCNLREWRHFFKLRTSKAAHPQMRALAIDMLDGFKKAVSVIFNDIEVSE